MPTVSAEETTGTAEDAVLADTEQNDGNQATAGETDAGDDAQADAAESGATDTNPIDRLYDGDYNSRVRFGPEEALTLDIPEGAAGLRFLWYATPVGAKIGWLDASGITVSESEVADLYETMLPVPEGAARVSVTATEQAALSEIVPIDAYEVENYLYFTDPLSDGPIDAMVFCAHAGDEFLSFGNLIPTMCEEGRSVLTVFMSHLNRQQLQEALDSARAMRQTYEPIFLNLTCVYLQADRYSNAKKIWDFSQTERKLLTMIRQYKPTVVFSHKPADTAEEGMRRFTANLVLQAVQEAAMPRKQGNITKLYGAHTVSKLYLSGEPAAVKKGKYDKSTPTPAPLPDLTIGSEAQLANLSDGTVGAFTQSLYENYKTLRIYRFTAAETVNFWLSYTSVGEDTGGNSAFSGIDSSILSKDKVSYAVLRKAEEPELTATPVCTPEPTFTPEPSVTPELEQTPAAAASGQSDSGQTALSGEEYGTSGMSEHYASRAALIAVAGTGCALSVVLFLLIGRKKRIVPIIVSLIPAALAAALCVWLNGINVFDSGTVSEVRGDASPTSTPESATLSPTPVSEYETTPEGTELPGEEIADEPMIAEKTPEPEPTPEPEIQEEDPDDIYFRGKDEAEEVVLADEDNGHWEYRSDTLSIIINRFSIPERPLVYFVAHIRMRDVDQFRPGFGNENLEGSAKTAPWKLARRAKAILAITGDNLVNTEQWLKGILIRNGRLYSERFHEPTLALMPDMSLKIYEIGTTADEILDEGVQNTFGFGPVLIRDGVIAEEECSTNRVKSNNPRCGLGMVEPGHYVAIVCDGRQKGYSMGTTLLEFAEMFKNEGCTVAYNMDGGISSGMIFMGESLNQHHSSKSKKSSGQRPWADALLFGYSDLVPTDSDPVYNTGNLDEKKERTTEED